MTILVSVQRKKVVSKCGTRHTFLGSGNINWWPICEEVKSIEKWCIREDSFKKLQLLKVYNSVTKGVEAVLSKGLSFFIPIYSATLSSTTASSNLQKIQQPSRFKPI